ESHGPDAALDTRGLVLVTAGALGLVWGLVRGNQAGWTSPQVLAALAAGVLLLLGFVAWQRRAAAPMLPLRLFRSRGFSAGTAASFLLFGSLYGSVFFLAQFMQTGLGYTPLEAGLRLVPWTATLFVVAPLAGALADRFGNRPILAGGLVLQAAGLAWIAMIAAPDVGYPALVLPLVINGIGASMAIPVVQNAVLGAVAPDQVGKASGANNMTQELGGVFGVAILVAVFTTVGSYASAVAFIDGFTIAIGACAALACGAAIAALAVPRPRLIPPQVVPTGEMSA
ncbi:MAG: MFS transporter, partial [Pseudonocardiaceae bacterium]